MTLLVESMRIIKEHWKKVASEFQSILPNIGGEYRANPRNGSLSASLICSGFSDETASRRDDFEVPVVPFLETLPGSPPVYWLGWYEEWMAPKSKAAQGKQQFKSSSVIVYYGAKGLAKRQVLRAEWAGPDDYNSEQKTYAYQGKCVAHPHWHVDGLRIYIEALQAKWERSLTEFELKRELAIDVVKEFGSDRVEQDISEIFNLRDYSPVDAADELAWSGIHLASNARWAEAPWAGPSSSHDMHANVPKNCAQIRSWLTSCVRYLQVELQAQRTRGRL